MADTTTTPTSNGGSQPLSKKSEAQLKREARARLKRLDPVTAADVVNSVVTKPVTGSVFGFVTFLREHAIVGLAVGFVIGTQIQSIVQAFIAGFVNPLFILLFPGNKELSARTFLLRFDGRYATFKWGGVAYALLNFLVVAGTIYAVIRLLKLDRLDLPKK